MDLKLYNQFPDELEEEWNSLLEKTATHVPFMRYEYQRLWWSTRGGGEWPDAKLVLVTAHQDGKLFAAAPLFYVPDWESRPSLMLVGSIEISDYLDLLVKPEDVPAFLDELLPFLANLPDLDWKVLDLYNILQESPSLPALEKAAAKMGWNFGASKLQHSPYIPLPGDWQEYLANIDKKQRHEIRRKMRRAKEFELPVSWYMVENGANLQGELDDFFALMRQDSDKAAFLTDAMEEHFRKTAEFAFKDNSLQLAFMKVGDAKAAGYLSFDFLNRIWVYNSAINWEEYADYSPGWVLLACLLKWANEHKREAFDFMRGDEQYKYRFGGQDRFVMRAVLEKK